MDSAPHGGLVRLSAPMANSSVIAVSYAEIQLPADSTALDAIMR